MNRFTNELTVKLGQVDVDLHGTFACIVELEETFNMSIAELTVDYLGTGKARVKDLRDIVTIANKHSNNKLETSTIEAGIIEAGLSETAASLGGFLSNIFAGAPKKS